MSTKLYKTIKWTSIILFVSCIVFLTLFLRREDSGKLNFGFGPWTTSSTTSTVNQNFVPVQGAGESKQRVLQLIIAFIGGGSLAFAGCLLQKITKNKLAEISILGIGSINILFIYIYARSIGYESFGEGFYAILMPVLLIVFSVIGTMIIWAISRSKKSNKNTFVIIGISIQLLVEALSVVFVNPIDMIQGNAIEKKVWGKIKSYTLGQIKSDINNNNYIPWWLILVGFILFATVVVFSLFLRKKIDTFESSEFLAQSTGVNSKKLRLIVFIFVALLAAVAACIIGTVALLGIIAPSLARMLFKNKFAIMSLCSMLVGGSLVALAAWVSMNMNLSLPVGILSTAIVAPYFLFLIVKER